MPLYEYRCENGHQFEVMQRISDDSLTECTECGAPVQKIFHPVAVHFKGSGFYSTDYGRKKSGSGGGSSDDGGGSSSSDSQDSSSKKSDSGDKSSKPDSAPKSGSSAD